MSYLFTSESVSEGHPDKIADRISDEILDNFLAYDPSSKVACEVMVTTGQVILAGEVTSKTYLDIQEIARKAINDIGYTREAYRFCGNSCGIISMLHEQSPEISQGVEQEDQGAGDQGIMFGYATDETENHMPLGLELANAILRTLTSIRKDPKENQMTYLRPDAKCQVTVAYSDQNKPITIDTVVISTQHDEPPRHMTNERFQRQIYKDITGRVIDQVKAQFPEHIRRLFTENITYHINPTGSFILGGPHGDTGLTGRKIIVDTYGGKGAHGGGAFSGKDPSKVDRSATYAARYLAKNLVAVGVSAEVLVQLSYAIGVAKPVGVYVNTYGRKKVAMTDAEIAQMIYDGGFLDLRPANIEAYFKLRTPIYAETSSYGHMGRVPEMKRKLFRSQHFGDRTQEVELFTWEKTNRMEALRKNIKF